jgi:predicted RNA-binding Zn-ribbon protein involved in translation (DUF1610 family)
MPRVFVKGIGPDGGGAWIDGDFNPRQERIEHLCPDCGKAWAGELQIMPMLATLYAELGRPLSTPCSGCGYEDRDRD